MAQQLMLSSNKKQVAVAPGARTEFNVTIQNLTTLLDDVAVRVEGVDASWVQIVPSHVPVFAQGEASVRVIIQPPLDPARAQAGVIPLKVIGKSQEAAGQEAATDLQLEIQFGGDYRLELGAGTTVNMQEAVFELKVYNEANAPLVLRCVAKDAQDACWYKFDPFQMTIPPGGQAVSTLGVRTRQVVAEGQQITFAVSGQGEWMIAGMATVAAPARQVNGQWGQEAPTVLEVSLTPYPADASGQTRFQVVVNNPGLASEAVNLEGSSPNGLLGFQFEPAQIQIVPRSRAAANVLVWLAAVPPAGAVPQPVDFWVTARPVAAKTRPGSAKQRFVPQAPVLKQRPKWLIPVIVGAVILLIMCVVVIFLLSQYLSG